MVTGGGNHVRVRRFDPLLSYLTNARGADEHNITEITEKTQGSMAINPASGNVLHFKELTFSKDGVFIDASQPIRIDVAPSKIRLKSVTNRGVVYGVPTSHFGNPINPDDIILIAELGIEYYRKMLEDSKSIFV